MLTGDYGPVDLDEKKPMIGRIVLQSISADAFG